MFSFSVEDQFRPCPACGAPVDRTAQRAHVCDPERRFERDCLRLWNEIAAFLASPAGRCAAWIAENERRFAT